MTCRKWWYSKYLLSLPSKGKVLYRISCWVISISVKEFKTSSWKWKCENGNLEKRDIPIWSSWEKETSQLYQMQMSWTNHNAFHLWHPILLSCCGTKVTVNIADHAVRKCNQLNGPRCLWLCSVILSESREIWQGGMTTQGSPASCSLGSRKQPREKSLSPCSSPVL